jgi:hypothetical protein
MLAKIERSYLFYASAQKHNSDETGTLPGVDIYKLVQTCSIQLISNGFRCKEVSSAN